MRGVTPQVHEQEPDGHNELMSDSKTLRATQRSSQTASGEGLPLRNPEAGLIHIFAALAVAAILIFAYVSIQDYVGEKMAERKTASKASARNDMVLSPVEVTLRVDGERYRVAAALGLAPSKNEMFAKLSKMSEEERAVAATKLSEIIKQPSSMKLETMIDLAYSRWEAVREYLDAQGKAK